MQSAFVLARTGRLGWRGENIYGNQSPRRRRFRRWWCLSFSTIDVGRWDQKKPDRPYVYCNNKGYWKKDHFKWKVIEAWGKAKEQGGYTVHQQKKFLQLWFHMFLQMLDVINPPSSAFRAPDFPDHGISSPMLSWLLLQRQLTLLFSWMPCNLSSASWCWMTYTPLSTECSSPPNYTKAP